MHRGDKQTHRIMILFLVDQHWFFWRIQTKRQNAAHLHHHLQGNHGNEWVPGGAARRSLIRSLRRCSGNTWEERLNNSMCRLRGRRTFSSLLCSCEQKMILLKWLQACLKNLHVHRRQQIACVERQVSDRAVMSSNSDSDRTAGELEDRRDVRPAGRLWPLPSVLSALHRDLVAAPQVGWAPGWSLTSEDVNFDPLLWPQGSNFLYFLFSCPVSSFFSSVSSFSSSNCSKKRGSELLVWLLSAPSTAGSKKLKEILRINRGRTKAGKEKRRKW